MLRIAGAVGTSMVFASFILSVFGFFNLASLHFLDPAYMRTYMSDWWMQPPTEILFGFSIISAVVIFILFFRMDFGSPQGGRIPASYVFDAPDKLFAEIKVGNYSLRNVFVLVVAVSFLAAVAGVLDDHVYLLDKVGFFEGVYGTQGFGVYGSTDIFKHPTDVLPSSGDLLMLVFFRFVGGLITPFALPFFLYWLLRLFREKITYGNLLALTVYLSLVSLAFSLASSVVDVVSYYLVGDVSALNKEFFPYVGGIIFYLVLVRGLSALGGFSLRKSAVVIAPFLALLFAAVLLDYFYAYVLAQRVFEVICWQLGVYS
jgi:hypothetical protein